MTTALNLDTFSKSLKETMIAFSFNIGGLLAGFIIASQLGVFSLSPWTIALYPAIVSAKGVIGGLLSGRLSTALHIGTIHPRFAKNTSSFYQLCEAIVVVTFATSVVMSLFSMVFGLLFWGIFLVDFPSILVVIMSTMTLGLSITMINISVAFTTFKKGLDPDVIVYPIMSSVADIIITFYYALVLNLFFFFNFGVHTLVAICLIHIFLLIHIVTHNTHEKEFVKTIRESILTMFFVAFVVNITGTVMKRISLLIEERREIYTVYPALIDMMGDVGSIVGSTTTTKLALGLLKPTFSSLWNHSIQIFSVWFASIIYFVLFGFLSLFINGIFSPFKFLSLVSVLLMANIIALTVIILISYGISIQTFKRGLDPDNFVIPIISSFADSMTTIALFVALTLAGLLA